MKFSEFFLSFFGAGRLPAPVFGTAVIALAIGMALLLSLGAESLFTLAFAFFLIGIFEINKFEDRGGEHGAKSVVIDKAVGLWVALTVGASGVTLFPTLPYALYLAALLSFGAFLLFETWAPSTIGWIRRNVKGGLGVMLDDVLSGFAAGLLTLLILKGIAELLIHFTGQ